MSSHPARPALAHHDTADSARTVGRSAFRRAAIEGATDLGGGYMRVKIAASDLPAASNEVQLPTVPQDQVRALLARLGEPEATADTSQYASGVTRIAPEENTALLDALADQAMTRRRRQHQAGDLLASAAMCARLGISRQALSKAVRERRMFWLDGPGGAQWYPAFFADTASSRRDLERVSVALAGLPGAVKWQFFTTPKHSLDGQTPVAAIRDGKTGRVMRTALEAVERNLGR